MLQEFIPSAIAHPGKRWPMLRRKKELFVLKILPSRKKNMRIILNLLIIIMFRVVHIALRKLPRQDLPKNRPEMQVMKSRLVNFH